MPQKKRYGIPATRKTGSRQNRRLGNPERCHSLPRRDPGGVPTAAKPITRSLISWKCPREIFARDWSRRPNVRLPDVDLTRPPKGPAGGARPPLTPPLTSTNPSEPTLHENVDPFQLPGPKAQEDDTASQGSMTIWIGDRDGEDLPSAEEPFFNFDWADENADKPPIPWDQVQAYNDFHDNVVAHEYWKWDRKAMEWRHEDAETGEVVYCPLELD